MKKIFFGFALSTMLFALGFSAEAQQPTKVPRIGYVSGVAIPTLLGLGRGIPARTAGSRLH